jgi:choline dehydrogenase
MSGLPDSAATIVVGAGSGGAAVAGLLAERGEDVLLLEAGPDYGPFDRDVWPADLLDARALPPSHDWGISCHHGGRTMPLERARVIGGCSAHNGCAVIWGSAHDYDGWAAAGNPGWSAADLAPVFARVHELLRSVDYTDEQITPFHRACLEAAATLRWPATTNLNDLHEDEGIVAFPVNIVDGVRWNAAFAYLDPVRASPRLRIVAGALVDRVVLCDGAVAGVEVLFGDERRMIDAERVVIAGGSYLSPAILMRSGIGPADDLRALGIDPLVPLDGVGRNLQDHPLVTVSFAGTPELEQRMRAVRGWVPEEQTLAKLRSAECADAFDVHVAPIGGPTPDGGWRWDITVACMDPHSRGTVRLASADPAAVPAVDNAFLSDAGGHDRRVLADAVRLGRELAGASPLRELIGPEVEGTIPLDPAGVPAALDAVVTHYFHPCGTCAMGPSPDAGAVVDAAGRVHGTSGLLVADCSIMPTVPRGNTALPAVAVGERIVELLAGEPLAAANPLPAVPS